MAWGWREKALASLRDGGWLTPGALLVVEEAKAAEFAAPEGFEELERRAYDDTEFVFLRAKCASMGSSCPRGGIEYPRAAGLITMARRTLRRPSSRAMRR